jgi:hypothetical protein
MTAADTNVRFARRPPAATARGAACLLVARLLLYFLEGVLNLDRKLLLLLAVSSLSACIIPVGPEFQDPLGVPNSPPYLVSAMPVEGTHNVNPMVEFNVTVGDLNVEPLFVKWVTEYPPFSGDSNTAQTQTIDAPEDGSPNRKLAPFRPECSSLAITLSTHKISVGISDKPFVSPEDPSNLFAAGPNAYPRVLNWVLERSCLGPQ